MIKTLVIAKDFDSRAGLRFALAHPELMSVFTSYSNGFQQDLAQGPQVILMEIDGKNPDEDTWEFILKEKQEKKVPVIALILRESLGEVKLPPEIDDFLVTPYDPEELILRVKRLTKSAGGEESIPPESGQGLFINTEACEVSIDGRKIDLTFKEYELLKLLAGNKGRVFTREALLNKIWGYDYYGGDRTVDVHIRRLRSKIEQDHPYIETVRNIGYRFIKEG
jgi:two-component system alkaline phosphatase synthesis response regulator PhoP